VNLSQKLVYLVFGIFGVCSVYFNCIVIVKVNMAVAVAAILTFILKSHISGKQTDMKSRKKN